MYNLIQQISMQNASVKNQLSFENICQMIDIIIYSEKLEHENKVRELFTKLKKAGGTLNREKCQFKCKEVILLSHLKMFLGKQPDPVKTNLDWVCYKLRRVGNR